MWRLAYLLSGEPAAAERLFADLMRDRGRIETVDGLRLDRMIVLRWRECRPDTPPTDDHGDLAPVYALPAQPLEAWLLRRVEQMDEVAAAQAMDCSKTALRLHLEAADHLLAEHADHPDALAAELRRRADALDPAPVLEAWRSGRRKRRRMLLVAAAILVLIAGVGGWLALRRLAG